MSDRFTRPTSRARRLSARFAVAGVAALAAVVSTAPMAFAEDDVAPDTASDPSTTTDTPPPSDPPPADETPAEDPPAEEPSGTETPSEDTPPEGPAEEATTEVPVEQPAPKAQAADAAAEEIVPDFGYNKFRVGVRIADGSTVPAGVTTLGSTIEIVVTGPEIDGSETTTCTTTIDPGTPDGATFCDDLNIYGSPFNSEDFIAFPGETVTITQKTVNAGLTIVEGVKIDVPPLCDDENPEGCGFITGDVLLVDAPLPVTPPADPEPEPEPDPVETALLPDTGGSNAELLALSLALIGSGGWLVRKGGQPRRRSDAVV